MAERCPTYRASSDRRHPRLAVAIGILVFRTIFCPAISLASRSKHSFLSHLPWRLPGVCSHESTDSKCTIAREGTVEAQGCSQADEVHQFQQVRHQNILPQHLSQCPSVFTLRVLKCIATENVRWQERIFSHSLNYSSRSQSLSGALLSKHAHCTVNSVKAHVKCDLCRHVDCFLEFCSFRAIVRD